MKLTDYIINFLVEKNVGHVFGLTGGAVVHLFDSAERHPDIKPVFHHHEQAAAFASQSYARYNRSFGACFITTGPGVTNALTGLAAAWLDSVPCIFISGQARLDHTCQGRKVRQVGTQHIEVLPLVTPMTKYAALVEDKDLIRYHLEKAYHLAVTGRPGPVWLDLPLDLQWADLTIDELHSFDDENEFEEMPVALMDIESLIKMLRVCERPLVVAGQGVVLSSSQQVFSEWINRHELPFITTWGAIDVMPSNHPLNLGRPGIAGQRGANLAIQNCDLLIVLGSHLGIPVTGTMFPSFARNAKIVMVDIDSEELKRREFTIDLPIIADVRVVIREILKGTESCERFGTNSWRQVCARYQEYLKPPLSAPGLLSPYDYVKIISDMSDGEDVIVVDGGGTNVYVSYQTFKIKGNQRMILSTSLCAMGSGLPESIGACYASGRRTLCLCGDGSLQLNIQELETIRHHQLPIKIFIIENQGYLSIRSTQKEFLDENYAGSEAAGGMSLPDYAKIGKAYGIPVYEIYSSNELKSQIMNTLEQAGPVICIAHCSPVQEVIPRQGFARNADGTYTPLPLEDMAPFLDRDEFKELMQIAH